MKNLLNHIQTSGELNKYWSAVDKLNDEARKAARKVERERKIGESQDLRKFWRVNWECRKSTDVEGGNVMKKYKISKIEKQIMGGCVR